MKSRMPIFLVLYMMNIGVTILFQVREIFYFLPQEHLGVLLFMMESLLTSKTQILFGLKLIKTKSVTST